MNRVAPSRPRCLQHLVGGLVLALGVPAIGAPAPAPTTVRTENYPRPPYSGATYYLYERGGAVICTKLEVCNKFDNCTTTYHRGVFKDAEDRETGAPYGTTPAAPIAPAKLARHACLVKFGLAGS